MSLNLKIENGDIQFDALGQLVFVDNTENIIQSVKHILSTFKGQLFYDPNYGLSQILDRAKLKPTELNQLQTIINEALSNNFEIRSANITQWKQIGFDSYNISLDIILTDDVIVNMDYTL